MKDRMSNTLRNSFITLAIKSRQFKLPAAKTRKGDRSFPSLACHPGQQPGKLDIKPFLDRQPPGGRLTQRLVLVTAINNISLDQASILSIEHIINLFNID